MDMPPNAGDNGTLGSPPQQEAYDARDESSPCHRDAFISDKVKTAFRSIDKDGRGIISKQRLKLVLERLSNFSEEDMCTVLDTIVGNSDCCEVSYEGFVDWVMSSDTTGATSNGCSSTETGDFSFEQPASLPSVLSLTGVVMERVISASNETKMLGAISDKAINVIMQVRGLKITQDNIDRAATRILPNTYMQQHPSFTVPSKFRQMKARGVGDLLMTAHETIPKFHKIVTNIVIEAGLEPKEEVSYNGEKLLIDEDERTVFTRLTIAPLKKRPRCEEKVTKEYDGDATRLVDIIRCSVVVDTEDELLAVAQTLCRSHDSIEYEIVRLKNRFIEPCFNGYRDSLYNIRISLGSGMWHVCEIQLHLAATLSFKAENHRQYVFFRSYFSGNLEAVQSRRRILEALCPSIDDETPIALARTATNSVEQVLNEAMSSTDMIRLDALAELFNEDMMGEAQLLVPVQRRRVEVANGDTEDVQTVYLRCLDLAAALDFAGQYEESLLFYEAVLSQVEQELGVADEISTMALQGKANIKKKQACYDEALEFYGKALAIKQNSLHPEHPDVASTLHEMGVVKWKQASYEDALQLYDRALTILKKTLGDEHPHVAKTLDSMGLTKRNMSLFSEAWELHGKALAIRERTVGCEHPDVARTLHNMGVVKRSMCHYSEALALHDKALAIQEKALGSDHADFARTRQHIALSKQRQGSLDEALAIYSEVLDTKEQALGHGHTSVALTLNSMGSVKSQQGCYEEALELFTKALAIQTKKLDLEHPEVATTQHNMAIVKSKQGLHNEALILYGKACQSRTKALGAEHPKTKQTKQAIKETGQIIMRNGPQR